MPLRLIGVVTPQPPSLEQTAYRHSLQVAPMSMRFERVAWPRREAGKYELSLLFF